MQQKEILNYKRKRNSQKMLITEYSLEFFQEMSSAFCSFDEQEEFVHGQKKTKVWKPIFLQLKDRYFL